MIIRFLVIAYAATLLLAADVLSLFLPERLVEGLLRVFVGGESTETDRKVGETFTEPDEYGQAG